MLKKKQTIWLGRASLTESPYFPSYLTNICHDCHQNTILESFFTIVTVKIFITRVKIAVLQIFSFSAKKYVPQRGCYLLFRQSTNKHGFSLIWLGSPPLNIKPVVSFVSSDRSSYSDSVLLLVRAHANFFRF